MRSVFLSLGAVLGLIAAAVLIVWIPGQSIKEEIIPVQEKQEKKPEDLSGNGRFFRKIERPEKFELFYGWRDYRGNKYTADFSISKRVLTDAFNEFGYRQDECDAYVEDHLAGLREEMIAHLKKLTLAEMSGSPYGHYFYLEEKAKEEFNLRLSIPGSERNKYKEIKTEFVRITQKIAVEQELYFKKIEAEKENLAREFLESRLLRFVDNKISIQYKLCVEKNSPRVAVVLDTIRKSHPEISLNEFLAIILGFVQEIRYGLPPMEVDGKKILEFWVPPLVLVNYLGDCDSKGVTFAAMWTAFKKYPLLLIKVPQHLFVGIAVPSFYGETLSVNGLRYSLCEVTGPNRLPPGVITPYSRSFLNIGRYRYELIH
ncbi:MAG: hypothetical protein JXB26_08050 [Candidatus Aminicenantes bacterium]|nr:hypothetical protein [Candidatus Aminicenantes bacterium]